MAALRAQPREIERRYTVEEFEQLDEFDERFELIDGRLIEKPMPSFQHGHIADFILLAYGAFDHGFVKGVMHREVSVVVGPKDAPIPDLSYWSATRRPANNQLDGAAPLPDFVIEVLSPRDIKSKNRREEVQAKVKRYLAAGVQIVWIINPKTQVVEVYQPSSDKPVQILGVGEELNAGEVIPGFTIKLSELFS